MRVSMDLKRQTTHGRPSAQPLNTGLHTVPSSVHVMVNSPAVNEL